MSTMCSMIEICHMCAHTIWNEWYLYLSSCASCLFPLRTRFILCKLFILYHILFVKPKLVGMNDERGYHMSHIIPTITPCRPVFVYCNIFQNTATFSVRGLQSLKLDATHFYGLSFHEEFLHVVCGFCLAGLSIILYCL